MGKINNTLKAGENFPAQFGVYWFNSKQLQKGITYYQNDQELIGTVIQAGTTILDKKKVMLCIGNQITNSLDGGGKSNDKIPTPR